MPDQHSINASLLPESSKPNYLEGWQFPGWGTATRVAAPAPGTTTIPGHGPKLGQWTATAIAGNDITSSVLYVGGM